MPFSDEGRDEEAKDASVMPTVVDSGTSMGQMAASALQSLSGRQQISALLDPNSMLMTNAAAAIAGIAASALNNMNQSSNVSPATVSSLPPALLAALRNAGSSSTSSNTASGGIPPHVAALLAAASSSSSTMGSLPLAGSVSSSLPTQLQQLLSQAETSNAATPTPSPAIGGTSSTSHHNMQNWTVQQLEKHVDLLHRMNQPVPQSVALLLADAQRKEKKKTAKRAANRKSASTSRARKKALVEEMTRTNVRLKRQALILALLPDLVVATTMEGEITFCSAQVERLLGHRAEDLVGLHLERLLVPSSQDALKKLFKRLADPKKEVRRGAKRRHDEKEAGGNPAEGNSVGKANGEKGDRRSAQSGSGTTSGAALISEQSFPLAVVEVDSKQQQSKRHGNSETSNAVGSRRLREHSDNSTSNNSGSNNSGSKQQISSLSNATGMSPNDSPSEDDGAQGEEKQSKRTKSPKKGKVHPSSDDSSLSSEAKKASDNLDRNVRWHNQRLMDDKQAADDDQGPKDDVTGASVTANNASARLSSLKHIPIRTAKKNEENDQSSSDDSLLAGVEEKKKVENQSDDSGYRESNDSREETSSSGSDSSNAKKLRKPLAPTCRICLIRSDLTTVWCEVTSSIREEVVEMEPVEDLQASGSVKAGESLMTGSIVKKEPVQEFLLCMRPMRDGENKADESMRLVSSLRAELSPDETPISSSGNDSNKTSDDSDSKNKSTSSSDYRGSAELDRAKKRPLDPELQLREAEVAAKKSKTDSEESSVVESLMLINRKAGTANLTS
eukprot:CAMPEP_0176159588 /NCGR_PEP_ID=MMETSP0120_2-20121206/81640_1 /TAXON_ID=160619 /ORGANISM="Kryptoperidinium foliaceum, Strain CCMP 1326" /LENGTH=786 /DNA_ID=CAMNT_0017497013 /DNA_START=300 /DNA_END=2660 /DNA_ORIENTATION=+